MKMNSILKPALIAIIAIFYFPQIAKAQDDDPQYKESCTSIMVGKMASTDGSVMTAHTCDAYYRTWVNIVPAMKFERDTTHNVFWGTMHTSTVWSNEKLILKGTVPEAKSTYAYLNTAYPSLNEKQLAIGETTFGGKRELQNTNGLFLIEELERIALQRCSTARQAIKLIGDLIKEYGYGDGGECITIADKKEVWQLEIMGEGPDKIGGVWAAQRIPDDHIGISANICRIGEIDLKNKDYYMASENVYEVAKKMKFWDGKESFKFWKAYGGRKPFGIRDFYVFNKVAPSLKLDFNSEELPFSVMPEKKLSVRDVLALYRESYDGTEWSPIKDLKVAVTLKDKDGKEYTDSIISPSAHPWMNRDMKNLINTLKPDSYGGNRPIAVQYCAYSFVVQLRDWLPDEIGGRLLFGFDLPRTSPRIPIYAGNLNLPNSFSIDNQDHFSRDAAGWSFRRASRLALVKWADGQKVIDPVVAEYENKLFDESEFVETRAKELYAKDQENAKKGNPTQLCREYLTQYTNAFAGAAINRWWELGDELWVKMRWNF
jgi:dipeptidase